MRLLGFKPARFREWWHLVTAESARLSLSDRARLWLKMLRGIRHWSVPRTRWRRRIRTCQRCPIYDPARHACRPFPASKAGCGCYVPFIAKVNRPYPKGCWADQFAPAIGGWSKVT